MKDIYCSYYTDSFDITTYMVKKIGISSNDIILEPSAGEGTFIDAILDENQFVQIDALDINDNAIDVLVKKYKEKKNVVVRKTDTLLDEKLDTYGTSELWIKHTDTLMDNQLDLFSRIDGHYTRVIGNPPYGAWQDYEKRNSLKKKYPGHYVKETYSLFLLRCISVLKHGGRLSFIIPDTFMFLNMHKKLRELLLYKTKIEEILIFPSKFFPGVSFGYSNLSIITLERSDSNSALNNDIRIIKGFKNSSEFLGLLNNKFSRHLTIYTIKQKDILASTNCRFILGDEANTKMFSSISQTFEDVADIVTGFYCGDNKKFMCVLDESVKGSKGYRVVDSNKIYNCTDLEGVKNQKEAYIPLVKGGSKTKYAREKNNWFIRWDENTIKFYKSNKKSRFQNSTYYFKTGIAIPMVKSSEIQATIMKNSIFDQSIVGIFPKNQNDLYYLLALMNSDTVNKLIHVINPTANNSANYIKNIPYIEPNIKIKSQINQMVAELLECFEIGDFIKTKQLENKLSSIVGEIYNGLSE